MAAGSDAPVEDGDVVLRPHAAADVDELARLADDRQVWRNVRDRFPWPYGRDDAEAFLAVALAAAPPTARAVTVGGVYAGGAGLILREDVERRSAEIGYWLGAPFRGRGVGTRVIRLLVRWTFLTHPDLHRLEARVYAWNPASRRALEKAGFRHEGTLRDGAWKDGAFVDYEVFGRLRTDPP